MSTTHKPVLLDEVIESLNPQHGESVLDCTLGLGGHASEFMQKTGTDGSLIGIDADKRNLEIAEKNLGSTATFVHANFGELPDCLPISDQAFDVIFADLGISSPHLDDPERGFTFRTDSPLDMRLDERQTMTAAKILSHYSDEGLRKLFYEEGELQGAKKLVSCIRKYQETKPIERSTELNEVVKDAFSYKANGFLPQVYQALRMAVNREREMLGYLLDAAPSMLRPGGRFGVISFHSLEDRLVKHAFKRLSTDEKDAVTGQVSVPAAFELHTKKPITPSDKETTANPRSRSAKLRVLKRKMV